jgi:DNA ligase-1
MTELAFSEVAAASGRMAATRSRVAKAREIVELLQAAGTEAPVVVGFLRGEPRQGKIGIGYAQAYGVEAPPAESSTLSVSDVDETLDAIAAERGPGSLGRRADLLASLFERATGDEQAFVRRMLTGEVRHGALDGVILDAVIRGSGIEAGLVRRAAMLSGDLGLVSGLAMVGDADALRAIGLEVLSPILPMLAATAESIEAAIESLGEASVEWKLDGARIQVHRRGSEVAVFTRNQNSVTDRLPDVVAAVLDLPVESVVLDGEAMSVGADGLPSPFQETMSRFCRSSSTSSTVTESTSSISSWPSDRNISTPSSLRPCVFHASSPRMEAKRRGSWPKHERTVTKG